MQHQTERDRRRVLCVDSDAEHVNLYGALLAPEYELTTATSAFDALRFTNEKPFDALVTEFWLPDWAGPSLCRQIRQDDPHAPVIFCTSAQKDTDRERAIRAGASAYLTKPVDPLLLLSKLRGLLSLASADAARARVVAERAIQVDLNEG